MLLDYLDRISIIHLPSRTDRYRQLGRELGRAHLPINDSKIDIPDAPVFDDAHGFPSKGVYGNFVSHLSIIKAAHDDGCETVMVLEDDAIFRYALHRRSSQQRLVAALKSHTWGMCFLGHPLTHELSALPRGLVAYDGGFKWAHCYLVHRVGFQALIDYLQDTMARPVGHPLGGKMYIDGAFSLFRQFHPEIPVLIANPALSVQRGSPSSLGNRHWLDGSAMSRPIAGGMRAMRDEVWRSRLRDFRDDSTRGS